MKPLASSNAIASASPKANAFVVDDVGAKSKGHASFLDLSSIFMSANLAIVDLLLLVNEAISFACLLSDERILIISSVSPELDIKRIISFLLIRPISPCAASVG